MPSGVLRGFQLLHRSSVAAKNTPTEKSCFSVPSVVSPPPPFSPPLFISPLFSFFSAIGTHPASSIFSCINKLCRCNFAFQRFSPPVFIPSSVPPLIRALGSVTVVVGLQTPQISLSLKSPHAAMWLCVECVCECELGVTLELQHLRFGKAAVIG